VQVKKGIEENRKCFQVERSSITHEPVEGGGGLNSLHPMVRLVETRDVCVPVRRQRSTKIRVVCLRKQRDVDRFV